MAWSIDRLTRKGCWGRDTVELLRGLQEAGIVLFTLEEDYDTSSARGKRRLADDLSRAEEESERISRRSRAGKEASARRGEIKGGGPRPFGTTFVRDPATWMREELQSQVDDARARMAQATRRSPLARYSGAGIREQWPALSLEEQRQIIKAVVDRVEVAPTTHGPVFDPSRLGIVWRA